MPSFYMPGGLAGKVTFLKSPSKSVSELGLEPKTCDTKVNTFNAFWLFLNLFCQGPLGHPVTSVHSLSLLSRGSTCPEAALL